MTKEEGNNDINNQSIIDSGANGDAGEASFPTDANLTILYITFLIIIGFLLLWIIIMVLTKENPLKILGEMNNLEAQIPPVSDYELKSHLSNETIIVPEGYVDNPTIPITSTTSLPI